MDAGREMDYKIAKDILELDCLKDPPYGILIPVEAQVEHYSTDYAAALPLIEDDYYSIEKSGDTYQVTLHYPTFYGEGNTLPLAICRAVLARARKG